MVKQASGQRRRTGGGGRRKSPDYLENGKSGTKLDNDFTTSARRALAFRRFWLFLLTAALVVIGLASVVAARFF